MHISTSIHYYEYPLLIDLMHYGQYTGTQHILLCIFQLFLREVANVL